MHLIIAPQSPESLLPLLSVSVLREQTKITPDIRSVLCEISLPWRVSEMNYKTLFTLFLKNPVQLCRKFSTQKTHKIFRTKGLTLKLSGMKS